jgi:glutamine synthetase
MSDPIALELALRSVSNADDLAKAIRDHKVEFVKVALCDLDGVLRGKYLAREKFLSALKSGFGFCEVLLGWDPHDKLYDKVKLGWPNGFRDGVARIVPTSARAIPSEPNTIFVLSEFSGDLETYCPRNILKRLIQSVNSAGFSAISACEYEFLVLEETGQTLQEKRHQNLKPHGLGNFGYSVIRNSVNTSFYQGLLDYCTRMNLPIEGLHEESGPGAIEAAIQVDHALESADRAAIFKTFCKVFAQRSGLFASFIAKWNANFPGQGGHIHMSLQSLSGEPVFPNKMNPALPSETMRHVIGGLQKLSPAFAVLVAPNVNSYRRLVPGYWAPTSATWGMDNRTVGIRAIMGSPKSTRVEYRIPGADANPYLAMAAVLGAAMWGIKNKIEPNEPLVGNAYDQQTPPELNLPRTLSEAAERFAASKEAHEIFGQKFVEHFAETRRWEDREFSKHVSDWELDRYFEII